MCVCVCVCCAEFRPQLLHEKLVSATTEASKTEMLFALVKNADGFKDLSREQLWQVVTTASYEVFANGQTVYATGDKSSDVYIILSGGVKVVMEGASIAFLCDRDVFGHLEVALRVSRRVASVVASEETKAVRLSRHVRPPPCAGPLLPTISIMVCVFSGVHDHVAQRQAAL